MKKKIFLLVFSLVILSVSDSVATGGDPFVDLLKRLQAYTDKYASEKVHLHMDKPYYAAGDDIWFKAYVIDAKTTKTTTLSNVLYVELINQDNQVIDQLKLPIQAGVTWGDFKLADTLQEGNYRIRSYTQLMRNSGIGLFFDSTVKIGNSWSNSVFVHSTSQYAQQSANTTATTAITYTDKNGRPYVNNEVGFEIFLGEKKITSGKLRTDNSGKISVPLPSKNPELYSSGKIITTFMLPDKSSVTRTVSIKATPPGVDVKFFPEGGHLIEGLPNRIAIKAIGQDGLGQDITGKIIDNSGTEVMDFKTTYLGMGSFMLVPDSGRTYTALIGLKDGKEQKLALPKTEKSGYVALVNNADSATMSIKIYISPDLIGKGELKLLAQQNGNIYFDLDVQTGKSLFSINVATRDFPSGPLQLNLFNERNIPVWERIVFINNQIDKIILSTKDLKSSYAKREKVDFSLMDNGNKIFDEKGSFSISVTNSDAVIPDPENESNILTNLLISSEVVGHVERPNHYFMANDARTRQELDNLMLTQAWRKIDWKSINGDLVSNLTFGPEKGLMVTGTVTTLSDKPAKNAKVTLFSNTDGIFTEEAVSDVNGRFSFGPLSFSDKTVFVVKALNEKGKEYTKITIDNLPEVGETGKSDPGTEANVNSSIEKYLDMNNDYFDELSRQGLKEKAIMLRTINVKQRVNPLTSSSNFNGPGQADFIVTDKDLGNYRTLAMYLPGNVPGLEVDDKGKFFIRGFGGYLNEPGLLDIFIDNIRIDTSMKLDEQIKPRDIKSIEVLTSQAYTGAYGGSRAGVLVITTKNGYMMNNNSSVVTYSPKGFSPIREFYAPKYDVGTDNKPDLRTTVYWNPNLLVNDEGKISINYYNTDKAGTYRMVIEGIDELGKLARKAYTYEVK